MPAKISDHRLSFIWTETVLDALTGTVDAAKAPLPSALLREPYIEWLNAAQRDWPAPGEPSPPWPPHRRQGFWECYLDAPNALKGVTGAVAWRQAVPVRLPSVLEIGYDGAGAADVHVQGFAYPWGVGLTLDVRWSGRSAAPEEIVKELLELRNGQFLRLAGKPATLAAAAAAGLAAVRQRVFGTDRGDKAAPEPMSIFTPLRGEGTKDELDPAKNEAVHRLIQASASFSPTWEWDELVVLDKGRVARRKQQPAIHYVFGTTRGRTIWGPAYLSKDHPRASLACQHRNLLFASLQGESLAGLARATPDGHLTGNHEAAARTAMRALGGLYLGGDTTYKTGSVKAQTDANGSLPAINALRERFELEKL